MIKQIQPFVGKEEAQAAYDAVINSYLSEGIKTKEYEDRIKEYTGYKYALAVSNWTDGLILCVETLKRKHEKLFGRKLKNIIVPNLTFVASFNAPYFCQVKPLVVDVDYETGQLDPNHCEKILKKHKDISSIMLVDLYGSCPDLDAFNELSKKYNVSIIEDAAQAMGVLYKGKHVGAYCENSVGGFSLYANKMQTCGEGGVFVTNNEELYELANKLKQHGGKKGSFDNEEIGFNFRMDDIRSSIAIEQLKKLDKILDIKKEINDFYREIYNDIKESVDYINIFPKQNKDIKQNYWFSNIRFPQWTFMEPYDGINIQKFLTKNDVETRRFFTPLSLQQCYKNKKDSFIDDYTNSEKLYRTCLSMPSHADLTIKDLYHIRKQLWDFLV